MMKRFNMFALVVLLSAATMGCTATQKWMTGGAVVGATVGGIWAHNSSSTISDVQGALIGGATGAAAGALVGNLFDAKTMKDLEEKNAQLEKDLAEAKAEIERLKAENERLRAEIERLKAGQIQMQATILSDVLFASGSARLTAEGQKQLGEIASRIKAEFPNSYVSVQGHTDSQPIKVSKWDDNWQLGCARSLAVMRFLIKQGVSAERASAETYGEYRPVVPNTSPENMKQNRRAVIVVRQADLAVGAGMKAPAAGTSRPRPAGARAGRGGRGPRGGAPRQ
ncbi:OmpA family protein [bacterium]|nr:OmpA family protein [bacterium]